MIIHVPPDAPFAIRALAATVLTLHIGGGVVGIAAGGVALAAPKGERVHRAAGTVFTAAMVVAYLVGAAAAPFIHQPANTFGGLIAAYLVASAWVTARRPEGQVGRAEVAGFLVAATGALGMAGFAVAGALDPKALGGLPWQPAAFAGVLAAWLAGLDLKLIRRGGLMGADRLARHLWRMCFGLFAGAGSFFIGQPKVFPPALRGSPILWLPPIIVIAMMVWWLFRVRSRERRPAAA